jgi:hypothetical protein
MYDLGVALLDFSSVDDLVGWVEILVLSFWHHCQQGLE